MPPSRAKITVRNTRPLDFQAIVDLSRKVYPDDRPWTIDQLASHHRVFPEGQFVAVDDATGDVVGMAASLIVLWDDYGISDSYHDFTDNYMFTNHDPAGRTLYAAEVMVDPDRQREGVGKAIYKARRELVRRLGLLRIRAGARLQGYSDYAHLLSPTEYVINVIRGEIIDPTLTFQLKAGFRVIGVVEDYLRPSDDPMSMGCAAIIEWLNHKVATRKDYRQRDPRFAKPRRKSTKSRDPS